MIVWCRVLGDRHKTVEKLGVIENIIESKNNFIDASGNTMKIIGTVGITISLDTIPKCTHKFRVSDTNSYNNVILGGDFMKTFGSVNSIL